MRKYGYNINRQFIIAVSICTGTALAGIDVDPGTNAWIAQAEGNDLGSLSIKNSTDQQLQIDGIRVTIPETSSPVTRQDNSFTVAKKVDDGNSQFRYDIITGTGNNTATGLPKNIMNPGFEHTYNMRTSSTPKDADWTPIKPQVLVIGGTSLAEKKVNKDITGITIEQLDSILTNHSAFFYDENLHVLDTVGIHGSPWGAGFVDTWYDQEKDQPIWQIQVGIPHMIDTVEDKVVIDTIISGGDTTYDITTYSGLDTFRIWGEPKAFEPDSMDNRDEVYGKGPMFLMGAAMAQEFMNIDMQYLFGTGFQESNAGLSMYKDDWVPGYTHKGFDTLTFSDGEQIKAGSTTGGWINAKTHQGDDTTIIYKTEEWISGYNRLVFDKVNYSNHKSNAAQTKGPMHYVEQSFKEYVYEAYPKFFPNHPTLENSDTFTTSTKTGGCEMNSPHIANAYFLSSLYMWHSWQLVVAKLGEEALDFYKNAENREISAQLVSWAWNKGFGAIQPFADNLDGSKQIHKDVGYVGLVWNGVNRMENANKNSVLAGGKYEVYDTDIKLSDFAMMLFGDGGNPTAGTMGEAGLFQHFKFTNEERSEIWSEMETAFNMLKGKAPSTKGRDVISYRYDYLAMLRILKKHLDLSIPVPKTEQFKNWTTTTVTSPIDIIPPFLPESGRGETETSPGKLEKIFTVRDSSNEPGHAGISAVEWSLDPNWGANNWQSALKVTDNTYNINGNQGYINDALTKMGVDTAIAWIKVTDLENNSLIDTFTVFKVEEVSGTPPVFDSAYAVDTSGDGMADKIILHFTEAIGDNAILISSILNLNWSWPIIDDFKEEKSPAISGNVVTISNSAITMGSGKGNTTFKFPTVDDLFSGKIDDRVSPAAQEGSKNIDLNRTEDIVTIRATEGLKLNSIDGETYLRFKKTGESNSSEMSSKSITKLSDSLYQFTFNKDEVNGYDSVSLVATVLIQDSSSNAPATNSIFVELAEDGGKIPLIKVAAVHDKDGDGYADSVTIELQLGAGDDALTTEAVSSAEHNWPKSGTFSSIAEDKITKDTKSNLYFLIAQTAGSGSGTVKLNLKENDPIESALSDRVGVALRDTARFDNTKTDRRFDTLSLPITEAIDEEKLLGNHVYLQFSADTTAGISEMATDSILVHGTDSLSALFQINKLNDKPYTFVRLMAKKDGLADIAGNTPHPTSKWIPIVRTGTESAVTSAAMIDLLGHGFATDVSVVFSEGSDPKSHKITEDTEVSYVLEGMTSPKTATITINDNGFTFTVDTANVQPRAGIGYLEITFSDKVYSADIIDSVGPAASEAILLYSETENNDIVRLLLSEKIDEAFSGTLSFRLKNSDRDVTVDAESAKMIGDSLEITFPFGTVLENDSIALVENDGITDLDVKNSPASNSRLVPFFYEGGKKPTILSAYALDNDGDGAADSIYTEIKLGDHEEADSVKDLESAQYSWPTPDNLQDADFTQISKTEIGLNGFSANGTVGTGKVALKFPSGIATGAVKDRVGPVIKEAFLYENNGGDDTLKVIFSESVKEVLPGEKTLRIEDTEYTSRDVYRNNSLDSIWIFVLDGGSVTVNENHADSVKIVHTSSLVDNADNSANDNNQKVEIQQIRRPIAAVASNSAFFDNNGDGELDSLAIVLESSVTEKRVADFEISFTWLDKNGSVKEYTVTADNFDVTDSLLGISLEIEEFSSVTTSIESGTYGVVTITQPDDEHDEDNVSEITPRDKMAPVLVEYAQYYGKTLTDPNDEMIDTLIVRFSEGIQEVNLGNTSSKSLFRLYDESRDNYSIRVIEKSFKYDDNSIGFITSIEENEPVPGKEHSIAIAGDGTFKDNFDNSQVNETRTVPFSTVRLLADYEVLVYPNPYEIGSDEPNPLVEKYAHGSFDAAGRLALVVLPFQNRVGENLTGTVAIYDVVGNVILPQQDLEYIEKTNVLMISADMTNQRGRKLASGMYRAVIHISSGPEDARDTKKYQIMIGVKK